jgi:hypothetical protein
MSQACPPTTPYDNAIAGEPQWTEEQHFIYLLQDRDIPCPLCGRGLRGLQSTRCPNCRSELALSLSLAQPALRAWITAMVAVCLSGGLGLFFLVVIFREGWPSEHGIRWICLQASLVYFMLSIPGTVAALALRRRYQRMTAAKQWCLAALCAASTGLALVLLSAFVVTG